MIMVAAAAERFVTTKNVIYLNTNETDNFIHVLCLFYLFFFFFFFSSKFILVRIASTYSAVICLSYCMELECSGKWWHRMASRQPLATAFLFPYCSNSRQNGTVFYLK